MDTLLLDENSCAGDLLPFTATRSVLDIRIGILTFREKWQRLLGPGMVEVLGGAEGSLPANLLPTIKIADMVREALSSGKLKAEAPAAIRAEAIAAIRAEATIIRYPWHIFLHNAAALVSDFELLTNGRLSQPVPASVQAIDPESIFIEEGARLQYCLLNASAGPIYIGRNAEIMEGALIRGPFAAGEGAVVKMGAAIYGATTLGPYCTAGGEIKNAVLFGYSNKGHDGYLGDAVIGEWCNLGAGTSASNLKNNAGDVTVWHPASGSALNAGLKCGLLMGDYSRCAINTSFNTGTVVGVCCNIFHEAGNLLPKYIPDFSWGSGQRYEWDKAIRDITNWKKLKNQAITDTEVNRLRAIFGPL